MTDPLDNSAPFDDDQGTRIARDDQTGAGAEAAEGIHADPRGRDADRDPSKNSSVSGRRGDGDEVGEKGEGEEGEEGEAGSEPLPQSDQHRSGYGGLGGKPKGSPDTR